MKLLRFALILSVLPVAALSCARAVSVQEVDPPIPKAWPYERHAIKLTVKADALLNLEQDRGHSLVVCIAQLNDPQSFEKIRKTENGLAAFIESGGAGDPNVVQFERIVVQPGDFKTLYLDRAEDAQWIGVVAGYYTLEPGKVDWMIKIPVVKQRGGGKLFKRTETLGPGKVGLGLLLGRTQILQRKRYMLK